MTKKIKNIFEQSIKIKSDCISNGFVSLEKMGNTIVESIYQGNKLLICGNGGSAADAQHLAAEMLVRLRQSYNRKGIPAISLIPDSSTFTACANDYSFDDIFERIVDTIGRPGDCLLGISTSGMSVNIIKAMIVAKKKNISVFGFLGGDGGKTLKYCDEAFLVPSDVTGRIQESHITAGHALMEHIEDSLIELGYIEIEE